MTGFEQNSDFEMEEALASSHTPRFWETFSLHNIHNQPHNSITSPPAPHISMIGFDDPMFFAMEGIYAESPSQTSSAPLGLHAYGSMASPALNSFQNVVRFQAQNDLSTNNSSDGPLQTVQPIPQKRAPKAPTMSARKWKPSEARIRQLYVRDNKPINEVREIINNEFGFMAK
jgi:hypothetical protein